METFTYHCVDLMSVCVHNGLDYEDVMESVSNSDVSFGTNDDTLITLKTLENILGKDLDLDNLPDSTMISLGS